MSSFTLKEDNISGERFETCDPPLHSEIAIDYFIADLMVAIRDDAIAGQSAKIIKANPIEHSSREV